MAGQEEVVWYQCMDESTSYPYFWNALTNEVVWELPYGVPYAQYNAGDETSAQVCCGITVCTIVSVDLIDFES